MNFDESGPDWFREFGGDYDDERDEGIRQEHRRIENLSVMVKAKELFEIVHSLVDTISEDGDLYFLREKMLTDAAIIPAKIARAEGGNLYTLRMENAVMIKLAARALVAHTYSCSKFNISNERYLELLRAHVDDFRIVFVEWVKSFDKSNDIPDDWGALFK